MKIVLDDVLETLSDDPMFFITSEGPVTGGYDIVLGSKALGDHGQTLKEYGGRLLKQIHSLAKRWS